MKVKINIKLNQANIKKLEQAMVKALPLTMEALKTEVNNMQVIPKDTGALEESAATGVSDNIGYLSYNTPYARKLFYHPEYNFRQDKNPNARGRWLDDFIYGEKQRWLEQTYGELVKRNAGGVIK